MGPTALFSITYKFHRTISANFYFYLQYFQQKVFSFSKINGSRIDPKKKLSFNIKIFFLKKKSIP